MNQTLTEMVTKIRCSSAPRINLCTASAAKPELEIDSSGKPSSLGSCCHEIYKDIFEGNFNFKEIDNYISKYDLDENDRKEVSILAHFGMKAIEAIKENMQIIAVEQYLEYEGEFEGLKFKLTGTADVIGIKQGQHGQIVTISDYKTGWLDRDYRPQLICYLFIMIATNEDFVGGCIQQINIREQKIEEEFLTREKVIKWVEGFIGRLQFPKYNPGEACHFCPTKLTCEARKLYNANLITDLLPMADKELNPADMETIKKVWQYSKQIKSAIDNFEKYMKEMVKEQGQIDISETHYLAMQDRNKSSLKSDMDTFKLINDYMGYENIEQLIENIPGVVEIKKKKLTDLVRDKAPKNEKGKREKEFIELLENNGRISNFTYQILWPYKKKTTDKKPEGK